MKKLTNWQFKVLVAVEEHGASKGLDKMLLAVCDGVGYQKQYATEQLKWLIANGYVWREEELATSGFVKKVRLSLTGKGKAALNGE